MVKLLDRNSCIELEYDGVVNQTLGKGTGLASTTSATCTIMTNAKIAVKIVVVKSFFGNQLPKYSVRMT